MILHKCRFISCNLGGQVFLPKEISNAFARTLLSFRISQRVNIFMGQDIKCIWFIEFRPRLSYSLQRNPVHDDDIWAYCEESPKEFLRTISQVGYALHQSSPALSGPLLHQRFNHFEDICQRLCFFKRVLKSFAI